MVVTVMKTPYRKIEPKVINLKYYKVFSNDGFRESLYENLDRTTLFGNCDEQFNNFVDTCNFILELYVRGIYIMKKKYVRGNQSPFTNKMLFKAILLRTRLRTNFLTIGQRKTE